MLEQELGLVDEEVMMVAGIVAVGAVMSDGQVPARYNGSGTTLPGGKEIWKTSCL